MKCFNLITLGWQYPYSVQHSAYEGHPLLWSSSSSSALKGAAGQEPAPVPAPRQPPSPWWIWAARPCNYKIHLIKKGIQQRPLSKNDQMSNFLIAKVLNLIWTQFTGQTSVTTSSLTYYSTSNLTPNTNLFHWVFIFFSSLLLDIYVILGSVNYW